MSNEIMEMAIEIPLLMTKDGEDFLISCSPLSIYIKEANEEAAKSKFEDAIELLFDKLIERDIFIDYLKSRDLIVRNRKGTEYKSKSNGRSLTRPTINMPNLELGSHARLNVPVYC